MIYRHGHPDVRQEEDRVPRAGILAALGTTLAIAFALAAWGWSETASRTRAIRPGGLTAESSLVRGHSVSTVMLDLFTTQGEGEAQNLAKRRELMRLEWLDGRRDRARIPINEAINAILLDSGR